MCQAVPSTPSYQEVVTLKRTREPLKEITHVVPDMPPRKRVRFCTEQLKSNEDDVSCSSSSSSTEEQQQQQQQQEGSTTTWFRKSDLKYFVKDSFRTADRCNNSDYLSLLACTYVNCYSEESSKKSNSGKCLSLTDLSAKKLALAAATIDDSACCARGLERLTSPDFIGSPTRKRRKEVINAVLQSYKILKANECCSDNTKLELLRAVSERHTTPAKRFANALGVVDTMSAWVVYGGEIPHEV